MIVDKNKEDTLEEIDRSSTPRKNIAISWNMQVPKKKENEKKSCCAHIWNKDACQ